MNVLRLMQWAALLVASNSYAQSITDLWLEEFVKWYSADKQYLRNCNNRLVTPATATNRTPSATDFEVRNRIVGGTLAKPNQIPYQAGLLIARGTAGSLCGGIVISRQHVLTAAHCTYKSDWVEAYLGTTAGLDAAKSTYVFNMTGRSIVVHSKYDPTYLSDDISLLILPTKVTFSAAVQRIPLACPYIGDAVLEKAGRLTASGWGKTSDAMQGGASELYFASLPVMPVRECMCYYPANVVHEETHICTETRLETGKLVNVCNGDSGGPLTLLYNGTQVAVGIASFVYQKCETNGPSGFTRVSAYLPWIYEASGKQFNPWWGCDAELDEEV